MNPFNTMGNASVKAKLFLKNHLNIVKKMDYDKKDIYLNIESWIDSYRLNSCKKEPETVKWIESFNENETFFDVGANIGAYSLIAAKFFDKKIQVYAFEPAFQNYSQLCRNIITNRCDDCITPLQLALSDTTKVDHFNYVDVTPGSAHHTLGEPILYNDSSFTPCFRQSVLSFSIDDIISLFKIPCPNHIKIDVDGYEKQILTGAKNTLQNPNVKTVLVEIDELKKHDREIAEYLTGLGFRIRSRNKYSFEKMDESKNLFYNYIFEK
jgi:FkbM family methyltransferase